MNFGRRNLPNRPNRTSQSDPSCVFVSFRPLTSVRAVSAAAGLLAPMLTWKPLATAAVATTALIFAALPATASNDGDGAVDGTITTVSVDNFDGLTPTSREDHAVMTGDGRVVPVKKDVRSSTGSKDVRALLAGGGHDAAGALVSATTSLTNVAKSAAPVAERLFVVAIQDSSTSGSMTASQASQVATNAANYWKREAKGGISSFTVAAATELAIAGSCYDDYYTIWAEASAQYPDIDFTAPGNHLVAFSPLGCEDYYDYAGVANVGSDLTTGGYVQVIADEWGVLAHELGHHFGLGHADLALQTSSDVFFYEYFGLFGPQALQAYDYEPGALDGAWRAQLGLPGESAREQVVRWNSAPAEYTLAPLTSSGKNTLVINDADGEPTFYLDYRSGAAQDARTFYAADKTGLVPASVFDYEGPVSYRRGVTVSLPALGDTYTVAFPGSDGTFHAAGRTGDSLTLMSGDVTIRVVSQTSTAAKVLVSYKANPKASTTAKISGASVVEGSKAKVNVTLASKKSKPTGSVDIYQDGKKVATRALSNGTTSYTTSTAMKSGKHTFSVRYAGTPAFGSSQASTSLIVKDRSKVRATAKKVTAGKGATLKATVYSDVTATGTVKVYKGSTYVGKATVKHGKATIHLPKSWKAKTYKLTVKYSGSTTVTSSQTTVKVVILRRH